MSALVATDVEVRYRKGTALRGCSLEIAEGHVVGLVGPNGAGKTTLLHLAAGIARPTAGAVQVFGGDPSRDTALLGRIALVAQDMPLYRSLSIEDHLRLGRRLNPTWDDAVARRRIEAVDVPLSQKAGTLSGGQRSQVALAIALGSQPDLLLLDEPLAALDPLARRAFLQALMETAAHSPITIVLSSHLLSDLERVCDHLVVLAGGRVRLADDVDDVIATHRVMVGPRPTGRVPGVAEIIDPGQGEHPSMIVRVDGPVIDPRWAVDDAPLEDVVLAYLANDPGVLDAPGLTAVAAS